LTKWKILNPKTLKDKAVYILKKEGVLIGNFKTATDILRLIAKISDVELNNKHIYFAYFSRTELSQLMTKLENLQNPMPDIKRYSKPWHTFFKLYAKKINFNNVLYRKLSIKLHFHQWRKQAC